MAIQTAGVRLVAQDADGFVGAMSRAQGALAAFVGGAQRGEAATRGFGGVLSQIATGALREVGAQLLRLAEDGVRALGRAMQEAVKDTKEFQQEFALISGLTNTTTKDLGVMKSAVLALSGEVTQTPKQLADALYYIASSGYAGAQGLDILKVSAKAASSGLGDTKVIADIVTSALSAYGDSAKNAGKYTDILTQAVIEGKGEPDQFAGALARVLPISAALGVSFEQVTANIATFTRSGASAEEAATALRGTLSSLAAPGSEAKRALEALGTSGDEVRKMIRERGLLSTLDDLQKRVKDVGQIDIGIKAPKILKDFEILDTIIPNIRALTGVMSVSASQADAYSEVLSNIANSAGATDKAFAKMMETQTAQEKLAENAIARLGISLGSRLLPALTPLTTAFGKFVKTIGEALDKSGALDGIFIGLSSVLEGVAAALGDIRPEQVTQFVDGLVRLAPTIAQIGAAIGGFVAFGGLVSVITGIVGAVSGLIATFGAAGSVIGGVVALLGGPLTLAVGAVVAVVAGLAAAFASNFAGIRDIAARVIGEVSQALQSGNIGAALASIARGISEFAGNLGAMIGPKLAELGTKLVAWISEAAPKAIEGIHQFWVGIFNQIGTWAAQAGPELGKLARKFILWINDEVIPGIGPALVAAGIALAAGVANWISDVGPQFPVLARTFVEGLRDGLLRYVSEIRPGLEGLFNGVVGFFKELFGIASPSTVFIAFGRLLIEGLAAGIVAAINAATNAIGQVFAAITNLIGVLLTATINAEELGRKIADTLTNGFKSNIILLEIAFGELNIRLGLKLAEGLAILALGWQQWRDGELAATNAFLILFTGAWASAMGQLAMSAGQGMFAVDQLGAAIEALPVDTQLYVKANVSGEDAVRSLGGAIDALHDRTITVTTNFVTVGSLPSAVTGKCFAAGTMIAMAGGAEKRIEEIVPGDEVMGYDHATGRVVRTKVVRLFKNRAAELLRLSINGRVMRVTPEHEIWLPERGLYAPAEDAGIGERMLRADVSTVPIAALGSEGGEEVYNFETETHNYFAQGVLVHNISLRIDEAMADLSQRLSAFAQVGRGALNVPGITPNTGGFDVRVSVPATRPNVNAATYNNQRSVTNQITVNSAASVARIMHDFTVGSLLT